MAPQRINLTRGEGAQLVHFLRAVKTQVLKRRQRVIIDFRHVEAVHVPGAILLLSEIDRIVALSDLHKPITVRDPRNQRTREVLKQIGLHELTGDRCDITPVRDDVVFWRASKGADQSGDAIGPIIEHVAQTANKEHAQSVEVSGIWRGVSEAVINTVEHAYHQERGDGLPHSTATRWWMLTQIRNGTFTAAVCDLGSGYKSTVEKTIPESFVATVRERLLGASADAYAIQLAMEYGRSSTKQSHRGKGSRDALSVLEGHRDGELHILSNSGWVRYSLASGESPRVESDRMDLDILGTIIWWKLPLMNGAQ